MVQFIHLILSAAGAICAGRYIGQECEKLEGWRAYAAFGGALALMVVWWVTGAK
jgi:hypothetical protein